MGEKRQSVLNGSWEVLPVSQGKHKEEAEKETIVPGFSAPKKCSLRKKSKEKKEGF